LLPTFGGLGFVYFVGNKKRTSAGALALLAMIIMSKLQDTQYINQMKLLKSPSQLWLRKFTAYPYEVASDKESDLSGLNFEIVKI